MDLGRIGWADNMTEGTVSCASHPRPEATGYDVLLVSSSGGVLLELLALQTWWSRHRPRWVCVAAPDTRDVLAGQSVTWVPEHSASRPWTLPFAVAAAWRDLGRHRPDVVVSPGTGVAVGYFVAAKLRRIPTVWIETLNLVGRPGLAARVCTALAGAVLVQRPELVASRPRSVYVGELY